TAAGQSGLLLVQALALGSGVFGVDWLAGRAGMGPRARAAWGLVYLTLPTILGVGTFDWHPDVCFIPAGFLALWGSERRRPLPFLGGILLAAATKITGAGVVMVLAGTLALRRQWAFALLAALAGAGTAALDLAWVFPHLYPHGLSNWGPLYGWLGPTPGAALRTLARHPARLAVLARPGMVVLWAAWLLPLGLWPPIAGGVRTGYGLVPLALAVFNGLSAFGPQLSPFNQYGLPAVPFLFASALLGCRLFRGARPAWGLAVAALGLSLVAYGGLDAPGLFHPQPNLPALEAAAARIPPRAPLIGTNTTLAPLAARPRLYLLSRRSLAAAGPGTYLLVDLRDRWNQLRPPARTAALMHRLARNPRWQVLLHRQGVWLAVRRSLPPPAPHGRQQPPPPTRARPHHRPGPQPEASSSPGPATLTAAVQDDKLPYIEGHR
ncbi:MAG: DUF2079 domain-containing protein, partial [Firmicutes bacterium]|nr:DUF2079 domain-containing protein [Bacillota bacterium]